MSRAASPAPRVRCAISTTCRAHDYSLLPVERYFALKGAAADRLHLVAGLPLPLRVLRRSGGVSRADGPGSHPSASPRRRRPPSAVRDGGARVSGRDVLHASRARRRAGRRVPAARLGRSPGPRRCAPIRPAAWARRCLPRRARRAAARDGRRRVGLAGDARSARRRTCGSNRSSRPRRCARATTSAPSSTSSSASRRARAKHRRDADARQASCARCIRASRRRSSTTGRIPAIRSPSSPRASGYVFPQGLEAWADFDYVGGRGPWITADALAHGRALQVLHAARVAARARGAGRCAPRRDGAAIATGTPSRSRRRWSSSCARRSRCRDGSPVWPHGYFSWPRTPKSSASCARTRRSGCCISRRI